MQRRFKKKVMQNKSVLGCEISSVIGEFYVYVMEFYA